MTTKTEDRLAAALRARADLVGPSDLGPVRMPESVGVRWRRRALALVAAAAAVAVAVVVGLRQNELSRPDVSSPSPSPTPDTRISHGPATASRRYRADVDGDGREDAVFLKRGPGPGGNRPWWLRVVLASGSTVESPGARGGRPIWKAAADLDGNGSEEVYVGMNQGGRVLPFFFTWTDGRIRPVAVAAQADLATPGTRTRVVDGRLVAWRPTAVDEPDIPGVHVDFWTLTMAGGVVTAGTREVRCTLTPALTSLPEPCGQIPRHVRPVDLSVDLDGDGRTDRVSVEWYGRSGGDEESVTTGFLVTARLSGGKTVAAIGPAGGVPRPQAVMDTDGDGRDELVVRQLADITYYPRVFALVGGKLVLLSAPRWLGSAFDVSAGAYWFVGDALLSGETLDPTVERPVWKMWSWRREGTRLVPTSEGRACGGPVTVPRSC